MAANASVSPLSKSFAFQIIVSIIIISVGIIVSTNSVNSFRIEEATIKDIQQAFSENKLTSRQLVDFYLHQIEMEATLQLLSQMGTIMMECHLGYVLEGWGAPNRSWFKLLMLLNKLHRFGCLLPPSYNWDWDWNWRYLPFVVLKLLVGSLYCMAADVF